MGTNSQKMELWIEFLQWVILLANWAAAMTSLVQSNSTILSETRVHHRRLGGSQCCRFSRNIALVTPKNIYFYDQKTYL